MPFRNPVDPPYSPMPARTRVEWRSVNIRSWNLFLLLFVEVDIILIISILLGLSLSRSGFVTIKDQTTSFDIAGVHFSSLWSIGLLWTAFPALLMTLFRFYWDAIVSAFADESPYSELRKAEGCSAKASILLDYRTYPSFYSWVFAFKNGHVLLGVSMLLSFLVSIILVPLSARLFAPDNVNVSTQAPMSINTVYNATRLNASIDYKPIFDSVSVARIHDASPPSWTDGEFAFPAFSLAEKNPGSMNASELSLKVTAYSAYLDCKTLSEFSTTRTNADDPAYATIQVTADDRGCPVTIKGAVGPGSQIYLKTALTISCSADVGYSRISFYAGYYSPSSSNLLKDSTVISCVPTYRNTSGLLKVLSGPQSSVSLPTFSPDRSTSQVSLPYTWRDFESNMLKVSTQDPEAPAFTSTIGDLFIAYAEKTNPSAPLSPEVLIPSASTIFTTVYAITTATRLFQPAASPVISTGTLTVIINRLHVVPWAAYVSIAIMAILILQTLLIFVYLQQNQSILREEPVGLIGSANLLYRSDIHEIVHAAHMDPSFDGSLLKYLQDKYWLQEARCGMEWTGDGHERVVITRMDARQGGGQEMRPLMNIRSGS
jgi:hypothetical protein